MLSFVLNVPIKIPQISERKKYNINEPIAKNNDFFIVPFLQFYSHICHFSVYLRFVAKLISSAFLLQAF